MATSIVTVFSLLKESDQKSSAVILYSCDAACEELDRSDGLFEVLCGIGPLDDLDGPFADPAQRLPELVTCSARSASVKSLIFFCSLQNR